MRKTIAISFVSLLVLTAAGLCLSANAAIRAPQPAAPGTITGTVYNADGTPADSATVYLFPKGSLLYTTTAQQVDGSYVINDVAPGQYRIVAHGEGLGGGIGSTTLFTVSAGQTTVVNVWLEYSISSSPVAQPSAN